MSGSAWVVPAEAKKITGGIQQVLTLRLGLQQDLT
jgi:hypothetical protein